MISMVKYEELTKAKALTVLTDISSATGKIVCKVNPAIVAKYNSQLSAGDKKCPEYIIVDQPNQRHEAIKMSDDLAQKLSQLAHTKNVVMLGDFIQ